MAYDISPDVGLRYWNLTPREFVMIAEGHIERTEREWYRTAWLAAHMLSPYRKQGQPPPKPHKLLGWDSPMGSRRR